MHSKCPEGHLETSKQGLSMELVLVGYEPNMQLYTTQVEGVKPAVNNHWTGLLERATNL